MYGVPTDLFSFSIFGGHVIQSQTHLFPILCNFAHPTGLEAMAEACKSVIDYIGSENIVYINVANRLSVDCDCDSNPAEPKMADIGIFASHDPVAIDQACVDAVYNSPDPGKKDLIKRIESRHGIHTVETAEKLGLGTRDYEIITV